MFVTFPYNTEHTQIKGVGLSFRLKSIHLSKSKKAQAKLNRNSAWSFTDPKPYPLWPLFCHRDEQYSFFLSLLGQDTEEKQKDKVQLTKHVYWLQK